MSRNFGEIEVEVPKSEGVSVNFKELNEKKVAALNCKGKAASKVGIVAAINYLGKHSLEKTSEIKDDEHLAKLEKEYADRGEKFEYSIGEYGDLKGKRIYKYIAKSEPYVEVLIDFPTAMVDYGGEIGVKPARISMNGTRWDAVNKIQLVGNPYSLKETTRDFEPLWSIAKNSKLYTMASLAEIIEPNTPFNARNIGKLIGKAFMFTVTCQIDEKGYLKESVKNPSPIPEGLPIPEYDTSNLTFLSAFDWEKDGIVTEQDVKVISRATAMTIKHSDNYEGSRLQKEFGKIIDSKTEVKAKSESTEQQGSENSDSQEEKKETVKVENFEELPDTSLFDDDDEFN